MMALNLTAGAAFSVCGLIGLIDCPSFIFIYLRLGEGGIRCLGSVKEMWAVAENRIWFGPCRLRAA